MLGEFSTHRAHQMQKKQRKSPNKLPYGQMDPRTSNIKVGLIKERILLRTIKGRNLWKIMIVHVLKGHAIDWKRDFKAVQLWVLSSFNGSKMCTSTNCQFNSWLQKQWSSEENFRCVI